GWASWLLLPALFIINLLLFRRRPVSDRVGSLIGFTLILLVLAGLIDKLAPALGPSPPVGSGGYLGALVAIFLELHFGLAGMILILGAAGIFGLALCHELLIVYPLQEARGWLRGRLRRGRLRKVATPSPGGPGLPP